MLDRERRAGDYVLKSTNTIILWTMIFITAGILSCAGVTQTSSSLTSDSEWCEIGVSYQAVDNLTVTLNSFTIVEKIGSYQYKIAYTLKNENLDEKILEGSFKMYYRDSAGGLPQYGFFNCLFPGDTITRGYTFEELKSKPFDVLEYHHDNFFSSEPLQDSLKWRVIIPDDTPPSTVDDYDELWHSADSPITLTATDYESGIAETYYRINNGSTKAVSIDGQPYITREGTNNTLEYWSINNADIEEPHHTLTDIKIDKTAPATSDDYNGLWQTASFTINLTSNDELSGVAETYYRINDGVTKSVGVDGQPYFNITQSENGIVIDGDVGDWVSLGLSPVGTDPSDNIEPYNDISSDITEAWVYTDLENLYLAMKVNGQGSYDFDQTSYQVYLSTDVELYKVKYFYWYDQEGYGYLFYWDEMSEIWQTRIASLEAQAGSEGCIEWRVPFFNEYGMPAFEYNSTEVSLRFATFDEYYEEEVNAIHGAISLPISLADSVVEGVDNTLEYWSVDSVGNMELPHKVLTEIKLDVTPPAGSITINNNETITRSRSVIATLYASDAVSGVSEMHMSNNNATWSPWETYSSSKSWTLSLGDGMKTIYVQFRNNAGLTSSVYSDSIILETPQVFDVMWDDVHYPMLLNSNSTISNFDFNQSKAEISFDVTGEPGTIGHCNITIPNNLLWGNFSVYVDGLEVQYEKTSDSTHSSLYFLYSLSTKTVQIKATDVIPEFPFFLALPLFMISTLLAVILYRREHSM